MGQTCFGLVYAINYDRHDTWVGLYSISNILPLCCNSSVKLDGNLQKATWKVDSWPSGILSQMRVKKESIHAAASDVLWRGVKQLAGWCACALSRTETGHCESGIGWCLVSWSKVGGRLFSHRCSRECLAALPCQSCSSQSNLTATTSLQKETSL